MQQIERSTWTGDTTNPEATIKSAKKPDIISGSPGKRNTLSGHKSTLTIRVLEYDKIFTKT